jgi:hypothetical protein
MAHSDHYLPLYDAKGNLYAVMLSADLWGRYRHRLEPLIRGILDEMEPPEQIEPMQEWEDFKTYWDFKYPYNASVDCGNCGAHSEDWTSDQAKPFRLRSAQLGGLVVFKCNKCGATIRKKHFKDHVCFEHSVNACGSR